GGAVRAVSALQVAQHAALRVMVAKGERLGLRKADRPFCKRHLRFLAQIIQRKPPPDRGGRKAGFGGKIVKRRALAQQRRERRRLIERRQVLALHVFDGGKAQRVVFGQLVPDLDFHAEVGSDLAALLQQLEGAV